MSAAVYATSEGLRTVMVTPGVPGGQAGTSSMIRNYLGFPRGLAGSELTNRAVEQAWLFGAEMVLADQAVELAADGQHRLVGHAAVAFGPARSSSRPASTGVGSRSRSLEASSAWACSTVPRSRRPTR